MANNCSTELYLRPLPFLDLKWLHADLISSLRNLDDTAILWNNLIQDCELVSSPATSVINEAGNMSYLGDDGKHYCGVEKLSCLCCSGYCGPLSGCNCTSCRQLDSDSAIKKLTSNQSYSTKITSGNIFESWLWSNIPKMEQKLFCLNTLLSEQHDVALQAAGNCLSSVHLRQQLYIYERYFVALARSKRQKNDAKNVKKVLVDTPFTDKSNNMIEDLTPVSDKDRVSVGLARVGTRAALNFSFAFLRRAWRSGEDMELCSELLSEALESLQDLPEASLFDTTQILPLWIEVLERSIKFLRQVVLGDVMGGRCIPPREDRNLALLLLLELGTQKGNLGSSLEAIILLLTLWEKENETDDNRDIPQNTGAPLISILKRYEKISNIGIPASDDSIPSSATESFLRFLTLPKQETSVIDLKQAAVVIISHLDRLAKPHMPTSNASASINRNFDTNTEHQEQQIFALGWLSLNSEHNGFTADPGVGIPLPGIISNYPQYSAPNLNFTFKIRQVMFSDEFVLFLCQDGKIYMWRFSKPESDCVLVDDLADIEIVSIASHCEGKHFLAKDVNDEVYSWGCGESGRLGHGDTISLEVPTKISYLSDKNIKNVYCGCSYSAAISSTGELYTWGRGTYGRLGHGTSDDKLTPCKVEALKDHVIVDVALGTGDSHSLCVTNKGLLFAWGDGDFGKLGNRCCNGSQLPICIEGIPRLQKVYAGSQFSVALSCEGKVLTWGRGMGGRLGHGFVGNSVQGISEDVNYPRVISSLEGKIIVDVSVGAAHCLAISNTGEVYGWGRNDYQQISPQSISKVPILATPILATHPSTRISGMACGITQSILWTQTSIRSVPTKLKFIIDLTEHTFRLLDQLLGMVCVQEARHTPSQESECIAVACLNLLRLQLHSLISNNISPKTVGLGEGSRLLHSIKIKILNLAGGSSVLKTMQESAQWALQVGWSVLLPTASERAQTLTSLLPSEQGISSSGYRFMTDLLVGSLMAEGGLEIALNQAISLESDESVSSTHNLPLLHLIKQLLRNNCGLTQARIAQLVIYSNVVKNENDLLSNTTDHASPSLDLLHKFQRLLFSHIHQSKNDDISGAEALLEKYLQNVVSFCTISLQKTHEIAMQGKSFVTEILKADISDTLLYEMLISLVLLLRDKSDILINLEWNKVFLPLLRALDKLNRVICDSNIQDSDDMGWPGILCRGNQKTSSFSEDPLLIRKNDIDNHITDGGKWVILNEYVCDVQDYYCDNSTINDLIHNRIGKDVSAELANYRQYSDYIINYLKVGKYAPNISEEKPLTHQNKVLTHFNSERTLAYLLGLRACLTQSGPCLQPAEIQCKHILKSKILSGGLQIHQPPNPFDDEKGEARSSASTAGSTPTEPSNQIPGCEITPQTNCVNQRIELFFSGMGEARLSDPLVSGWNAVSQRFCKENNLIWHQEFPPEHPVQELERLLSAVLIRHQSLGPLVLAVIDRELSGMPEKPPKEFVEIIRLVYQTKWTVVRTRQQLNRSYKEVCAPILERLRFLLFEVRPVISLEQSGFRKLHILHRNSRFKTVVKKIISEIRIAKKQLECIKPEDILNVTIQSQNAMQKNQSQENLCKGISSENLDIDKTTSIENIVSLSSPLTNLSNENLIELAGDNILCDKKPFIDSCCKSITDDLDMSDKKIESEQMFLNDVILKLSKRCRQAFDVGELNLTIMNQIVDFVMQEVCDVETVRRAMYCQVQRYKLRLKGINMFNEILGISGLLDAVQYNMLSGFLGLHMQKTKLTTRNILEDLNMITAYQKSSLILAHSKILEWAVMELQKLVNQEQISMKIKFHGDKDNSNLGTYVFLKKLPRARFLLSVFGILAKDIGSNELSFLVNKGILGTILGLLRQTGSDVSSSKQISEFSVVYEDTILKQKSNKSYLSGPELAKLMKIGTRICRGADWKWGDQDGNPPGEGKIISEVGEDGWVRVEWDTGTTNSYRMGKEGQYDLRLADNSSNIVSPDTETEKDEPFCETQLTGEAHPTKLLRFACMKMLQLMSVSLSIHSEKMQKSAVYGITSMFRAILNPDSSLANIWGLDNWTTLGFLRSIAGNSKIISKHLTSSIWIKLLIDLIDKPILLEQDVFKKVNCLRLLQTVLVNWTDDSDDRYDQLVQQLFTTLGKIVLYCPNDVSLLNNPADMKSRVLLSASHSGTVAEEIITLLRKLHTLPLWNTVINSFLSQKLCVAADLFTEDANLEVSDLENQRILVLGALSIIGGCDPRPRLGLQVLYDGVITSIRGFNQKGKCILNAENDYLHTEFRKISLNTAVDCAEYSTFSLSRLPMSEMLLNAWAVLIYGAGERKETNSGSVDCSLLRFQQIQLFALNSNCVLYRHQSSLRKILRQRSPGLSHFISDESISEHENLDVTKKSQTTHDINVTLQEEQDESPLSETELLIQGILIRATQPSPLKATYSYQEITTAALNVSQMLASHVHSDASSSTLNEYRPLLPPMQPTLIHGVPIYNDFIHDDISTSYSESNNFPSSHTVCSSRNKLAMQIMEMGFSRKSVELAISTLTSHSEISPTPEQIVQWILEHSDICPPIPSTSGAQTIETNTNGCEETSTVGRKTNDPEADSDDSTDSSNTVEGLSIQDQAAQGKFATQKDFSTVDQYAMYVRGLVCPGMIVKCCLDFEEVKKGDMGTVLKVDTEGLHDLNVQVDWKMHGGTFWVCFVHIELIELPKDKQFGEKVETFEESNELKKTEKPINRTKWTQARCSNDNTIANPASAVLHTTVDSDLIEDWSRCIRTLTVSSNELNAKYLLDRSVNYWQSSSNCQGKHWIRLEMHDNVLIHNLIIVVNPADCSHMPSLVMVRVGDNLANLKDLKWVSIKNSDVHVQLLSDVRQYYQFVEIVIKECRNNGIQCKVHGLNIVGRRKQTDLDLMLMNASFLACEYDNLGESSSSTTCTYPEDTSLDPPCTVMVWGLNDKEQLGGLKGSKVRVPTFSQTLSRLRPINLAGGSKSLFIVSQDGKVYACGEGTNSRLGLGHNCNVSIPRVIPVLHQYVVKKVAVHSGGKHALALTLDGKVFSWGEGEDGKLGHGNRATMEKPRLIESLRSKKIRDIACGSSHSAAITSSGELYTWGLGEYGRLGHGDNCTQLKPKMVQALAAKRVVQVACGSRDAQTLALTDDGVVYSWGDGDFGKLGRGGSEGSSIPHEIERLTGIGVVQIECGAQFSLALTHSGEVWTWGKGDYFRLGHGSDQHVRKPAPIQGLRGKKVIHVAVGALHCLAVTDSGQVYAWGDNDHGQQGSGNTVVNKKPALVVGLDSVFVNRVACGSSHSVAWGLPQASTEEEKKGPVAFSSTKDALGGSGLGIYDSDPLPIMSAKQSSKVTLSETLLSLQTFGARQTALNYLLNAMSILQARQLIVSALTSHSKVNINEKIANEIEPQEVTKDLDQSTHQPTNVVNNDVIAHGGGEAPADPSDPAVHETSPEGDIILAPSGPLSAFQSLTGSLSLSASISSNAPKHTKMSASAMSVMAATMTHQEEMIAHSSLTGLDDFTSLLGESEAKSLIELLKLSVAGRTGPQNTVQTIADTLIALGSNSPSIGSMLIETAITELEDLCTSRHSQGKMPKPVLQETSHPYIDDITLFGHVKIPGAEALRLEFDSQCSTEKRNDPLVIMDSTGRVIATRSGREFNHWSPEIRIPGDQMRWKFTSDSSVNGWGWRFWVHAIMPASFMQELGSDRAVLSQPSMPLVMALLDSKLSLTNSTVLLRLASALSTCAQLSSLTTAQRIWALKKLHSVLNSKHAPKSLHASLDPILLPLIPEILRQYEYEEPQVRGGIHLMHSEYFKTLVALACDMQLDSLLPSVDMHKWSWFRRYCTAVRVAQSLVRRIELPRSFCLEVRKKLSEMTPLKTNTNIASASSSLMINSTNSMSSSTTSIATPPPSLQPCLAVTSLTPTTSNLIQYIDSVMTLSLQESEQKCDPNQFLHEDHTLFKAQHDSQLLQWLNRRPEDWALSWGGASTIYGWGHNHRGQLGGLDGSRIKNPTPCEALSLLRPVQLAGGEQTLYAVTPDGKLFATGYGAGGRLGIGGTDSVTTPTLVESLQHVFIKKVAVNSGGKHCLALTTEGEVYSWGEGEDGKLGHGNRMSYDLPKLIEVLAGVGIVDIACGSAHSACITSAGHVLTWGKGRYGRLGHGDSEDQLRPNLVEALLGYRAIDIACGSGDAQTICITDDDNVWSWGDGDYGKLGRGGSDGCKLPIKIESLSGLGVIKVECGSQFSVALTRSGAVYTWGKGDYHRLGHGTVDHVRRPKKVAALQSKKIISIATGSLHCVACSDSGEVYTWGDNDEGQLGDGTVSAIQRPRLVTALQGKHIVKVTCGSAHTLALSTSELTEGARPPPNPPLEYDLVRDLPPQALHARLVLLHHFTELICPCLAMLHIMGDLSLGALKDVLVYSIKEAAFRKVIQTTMVRDKQHGPVIELNRIQVKRSRNKSGNGLAGVDGMKSVFGQMVQKLPLLTQEALSLPHRVWKVKFVGESVDDCGGGYSESIAEMCDELQNGSVPLLIATPNGRGEAGANRDCFLLDPTLGSVLQMNMFRFLGVLMGIAVRTGSPLSLNLAEPVWRQLAGENLRPTDLTEVDRDYVAGLLCVRNMEDDPKVFNTLELPFSTSSAKGHEVPLSTRFNRITPQNRHEYVRLALNFRLHEFDEQVKAVRDGMSKVIPVPLLSLFSASELQAMVCGSPDIPLGLLKSVANYKGVDSSSQLVKWFWEVMEEFSNQERSLFLRFVWGRTRLPRTIADFRGRDFVLQVLDKYNPPDHFLPESYTCFFLLKMPRYSCKSVLLEKLKYAIHFCKSIDTDEYARVAMGDPTEATGSEDNSDIESVASNDE